MRILAPIVLTLMLLLVVSCSRSIKTVTPAKEVAKEDRAKTIDDFKGGFKLEKDKETGFTRAVSDKEGNPFGSKTNPYSGKKNAMNKKFDAGEFDSKRWEGDTKSKKWFPWSKGKQEYANSPVFIKQNSDLGKKDPRESGRQFENSEYTTASARESKRDRISRELDDVVEGRRSVFVPPPIIGKGSYDGKNRSVEGVKQMLGQ